MAEDDFDLEQPLLDAIKILGLVRKAVPGITFPDSVQLVGQLTDAGIYLTSVDYKAKYEILFEGVTGLDARDYYEGPIRDNILEPLEQYERSQEPGFAELVEIFRGLGSKKRRQVLRAMHQATPDLFFFDPMTYSGDYWVDQNIDKVWKAGPVALGILTQEIDKVEAET